MLQKAKPDSKTVWLAGDQPLFATVNQGRQITMASLWEAVHQKFILQSVSGSFNHDAVRQTPLQD